MTIERTFVPALGWRAMTPLHDAVVRTLTRERTWRTALVEQIAPEPGETILDVGCGTGSRDQPVPGAGANREIGRRD